MSHFSLLVVTENNSEEEVTEALQPFHEYECTGIKDEFVKWVDHTAEVKLEWTKGKDYKDRPFKERYDNIRQFATDYHGYQYDEASKSYGCYTNVNAKWDWWVVGGRYEGKLQLHPTDRAYTGADNDGWNCLRMKQIDTSKLTTFGVLLDGEWIEQGSMGWWACVSDEKDPEVWDELLTETLARINPEHFVTVVDVHI